MIPSKSDKKRLILKAAFQLFLEKGYTDTKIIDIAKTAGIGKGTVYEYFSGKEALFLELFKEEIVIPYRQLSDLIKTFDSCEEQFRAYLSFEVDLIKRYGDGRNKLHNILTEAGFFKHPDLKKAMHEVIRLQFEIMKNIVQHGIDAGQFKPIDPEMAAIAISGAVHYFLSVNYNMIPEIDGPCLELKRQKQDPWSDDDLLRLLYLGLKKNE